MAYAAVRMAMAALIVAAVIAQAALTVSGAIDASRDVTTTVVNFFSFFTIQSNVVAAVTLALGALWTWARGRRERVEPRWFAILLACATSYMLVTGVVYNLLLRNVSVAEGLTVPWSNEVLHVFGPLFLLVDLFVAPRRRALPWSTIGIAVIYPIAWVVYTLIRGPLTTAPLTGAPWWYPYPFLDPHLQGGYGGVAVYIVGIAVAMAAFATLVVCVGRRRGRHRA